MENRLDIEDAVLVEDTLVDAAPVATEPTLTEEVPEIEADPFPSAKVSIVISETGATVPVYRRPKSHSVCNGKGYLVYTVPGKDQDRRIEFCNCVRPSQQQYKAIEEWQKRNPPKDLKVTVNKE